MDKCRVEKGPMLGTRIRKQGARKGQSVSEQGSIPAELVYRFLYNNTV